jgi:hypothetical protein
VERRAEVGDCCREPDAGGGGHGDARRDDICPGQIYRWPREIRIGSGFAEVLIAPAGDSAGCGAAPAI